MPLIPTLRLVALMAFIGLVAVAVWLADLPLWLALVLVAAAWVIAATIELLAWRAAALPVADADTSVTTAAPPPPPAEPDQGPSNSLLQAAEAGQSRDEPTAIVPPPPPEPEPEPETAADSEPGPALTAAALERERDAEEPSNSLLQAAEPEPIPATVVVAPAPRPEPHAATEPPGEPERPRRKRIRLRAVPAPRPEPAPAAAPAPATPPPPEEGAQVVAMPARASAPREWNLWDLERLAREESRAHPERRDEWAFLFVHLRQFANADGMLPADFDPLVRESFGGLLEHASRG